MRLELASRQDIPEITNLYRAVCRDMHTAPFVWAGWEEGLYPTEDTAQAGLAAGTLYVMRVGGEIVGTTILNHDQPEVYRQVAWFTPAAEDRVLVIHTFMTHPRHGGKGFGMRMLQEAARIGRETGMAALRLDTSDLNFPAQRLYQKAGYRLCGLVDLGLNLPDRRWFHCFECDLRKETSSH